MKADRLQDLKTPALTPQGNGWWCENPTWLEEWEPNNEKLHCLKEHARLVIQGTPEAQARLAEHCWKAPFLAKSPLHKQLHSLCEGWLEQGLPPLHPHLKTFLIAWMVGSDPQNNPAVSGAGANALLERGILPIQTMLALLDHDGSLPVPPEGRSWRGNVVDPNALWSPTHPAFGRVQSALRDWNAQVLAPVQPRTRRRQRP
jgi:hypothetical protein